MLKRSIIGLLAIGLLGGCGAPPERREPERPATQPANGSSQAAVTATANGSGSAANPNAAGQAQPAASAGGVVTRGGAGGGSVPAGLLAACAGGARTNFNPALSGTVTAADGSQWIVPAPVSDGPAATDYFNDCAGRGDNAAAEQELQTVVVDQDGVEITGTVFADNYFELWVNGAIVARDTIGFTPFNGSLVRFKAKYPITYAVKLVDWETHLGLGMEYGEYKVGDGGFIALFSDGTATGGQWRAETFYIAPLDDPSCVTDAAGRDSSGCRERPACADGDPETCQALHYPLPADWALPAFDDKAWPAAAEWEAAAVTNAPAYASHAGRFGAARFIWTRNLRLDNLVLARYTAQGPAGAE